MSNKAIVFYTGELKETQENTLRQIHGVENIIFVPIESVSDLETKILEKTERPFIVYNYLTEHSLVIALCDKLSSFTIETGYKPEYFIWLDHSIQSEVTKMPINKSRIFVITEATLAISLNLKKEEINESVEVISINLPATSEEHIKQVFDCNVFRGYTKPTFVLIDDRHKYANHIASLVPGMNAYGNINVKVVDMRDLTLMEILKKQTDLELRERLEGMKVAQLASSKAGYYESDEIHINVDDATMPKSVAEIKARMDSIKAGVTNSQTVERPDPYLSYGEAIEMCKKGIDVASVNWKADEFLTVTSAQIVPADKFWSPGNRRAAEAKSEKSLIVNNYFLRTNKYSTVPHQVSFVDQFDKWVVATDRVKVKTVEVTENKLQLNFALDTNSTAEFELAPFWIVYDVLASLPETVTVLSDNPDSWLPHIIASIKHTHEQRSDIKSDYYTIKDGKISYGNLSARGVNFVYLTGLSNVINCIRSGEYKNIIVDTDSYRGTVRMEKLTEALMGSGINWASVSLKEQLFGDLS